MKEDIATDVLKILSRLPAASVYGRAEYDGSVLKGINFIYASSKFIDFSGTNYNEQLIDTVIDFNTVREKIFGEKSTSNLIDSLNNCKDKFYTDYIVIFKRLCHVRLISTAKGHFFILFNDLMECNSPILQAVPFPAWIKDVNYKYLTANQAFCEKFDKESVDIIGKDDIEIFGNTYFDGEQNKEKDVRSVNDKKRVNSLEIFKLPNEDLWLETFRSPIFDKDDDVIGLAGFSIDVTKNVILQENLRRAKEEAEKADIAKSEFLARMSHEIRTPMNGIINLTELVLDTNLSETQRDYLNGIKNSANILLGVINDILDFSKMESGNLKLETTEFDVRNLIYESARLFALKSYEKGIEIICNIDKEIPPIIVGDSFRIKQVLSNLISDSCKFTESGEIIVSLQYLGKSHRDDKKITVLFKVSDTGVGISRDKLEKVFEEFEQENTSITRKYGGAGLGLTICKRLIDLMNGKLYVESEQGKGSTFSFELELAPLEMNYRHVPHEFKYFKKALILEEKIANGKNMVDMLQAFNIKSDITNNYLEAFRKLSSEKYDIFFLNYSMSYLNGLDFAEKVRKEIKLKSLPIILTLYLSEQRKINEFSGKFYINGYLLKPVSQSDIFEVLKSIENLVWVDEQKRMAENIGIVPDNNTEPKIKIMIAEDNDINTMVLSGILKKMHYSICHAVNGSDAVELYKKEKVDLIFMDIHMPVMDGIAATKEIRRIESEENRDYTPIIAITADAMHGDKEKYLSCGMDYYISKPFKRDDILTSVSTLLHIDACGSKIGAIDRLDPSIPVFNKEKFLAKIGGNQDVYQHLINLYLNTFPEKLNTLKIALSMKNYHGVNLAIHNIKGAANTISSEKLCAISNIFMKSVADNVSFEDLENLLSLMFDAFEELKKEV